MQVAQRDSNTVGNVVSNTVTLRNLPGPEAFGEVSALLHRAVQDQVFPGAVLLVGQRGRIIFQEAVGSRSSATIESMPPVPMKPDMVFDIAGLTQLVVTCTLLMKLLEAEQVRLDDRISRYIQPFGVFGKSPITVAQVLSHRAGFPTWQPYFEELLRENAGARMGILTSRGAREFIYNLINRSELQYEPGTQQLYSDIGFILLGHLIEILTGSSLDRVAQRYIFNPLTLRSTSFVDLSMIKRRGLAPVTEVIAPTEDCAWRKRVLCGEVQDDNAWVMGGVAGHSGLFSSAPDLHRFATELLAVSQGSSSFVSKELLKIFWYATADVATPNSAWRLGWDSPSAENEMNHCGFGDQAVGMNGATGCSIWLDPERLIDIVFMSNRMHPNRHSKKIRSFRPELFKALNKVLVA